MFSRHFAGMGPSLAPLGKRAITHMGNSANMMGGSDAPGVEKTVYPFWFIIAMVVIFVSFLPVLMVLSYTFNNLLPTLAMIEDPSPPAYEPLSSSPDDEDGPGKMPAGPVTASIRQTTRMLRSIGGFRSYFRGIWCAIVASIAVSTAQNFFSIFLPDIMVLLVAPLPAILITLPLTTAWTHIVMSAPKSVSWYSRLPPTKKTFTALWRPAFINWLAVVITTAVPTGMIRLMGVYDDINTANPNIIALSWKTSLTGLVGLVLGLSLMVPAHVIFTRIQASLLPVEDEPIIAFDRSFGGHVEPEVVGGKGYATISDAWKTFTRENWMRLIKLYVKIIGLTLLAWVVLAAVIIPTWMVAAKSAHHEPAGN